MVAVILYPILEIEHPDAEGNISLNWLLTLEIDDPKLIAIMENLKSTGFLIDMVLKMRKMQNIMDFGNLREVSLTLEKSSDSSGNAYDSIEILPDTRYNKNEKPYIGNSNFMVDASVFYDIETLFSHFC